jgi:plastocyanin domain-containing protein
MRRILVAALAAAALSGCAASGPTEIAVQATANGFEPKQVTVAKGTPAVLVITRVDEATCATEAIFTETGRKYELPLHQPVRVELPTGATATLHYACGMDMWKGEVVVK